MEGREDGGRAGEDDGTADDQGPAEPIGLGVGRSVEIRVGAGDRISGGVGGAGCRRKKGRAGLEGRGEPALKSGETHTLAHTAHRESMMMLQRVPSTAS
jgi:hypothetical protein